MKRYLTIITLFLFSAVFVSAQNISVTDFHLDEMDLTANQQGTTVLDQNGEKCALIKVKTTQTGFSFDAGSLGVTKTLQKTAEIWVYVPHGVRKLNISHQKFGQLDYQFPVTTQKAKTYIMDLKAETPLPVDHQRLTIKCQPKNAIITVDGEMVETDKGVAEITLKLGSHDYVALAKGYYQSEGTIKLTAERPGRLTIDLEPKEGTVVSQNDESLEGNSPKVSVEETQSGFMVTVNKVKYEMVKVDGGTFMMGEKSMSGERRLHQVTLSNYYIGKFEVTQALWEAVMGSNPTEQKGKNLPVEATFSDCCEFISKLNKLTNKTFRMPTEAEWEYACIGGNNSKGYKYSGSDKIDEVGWIKENSNGCFHEIGLKLPNELGLYDMIGNEDEWCQDYYAKYSKEPQTNPTGPSYGKYRVVRGGSIYWKKAYVSTRARFQIENGNCGLRLTLSE